MKIGINASFLRKPGTGIGQVTVNFLRELAELTVNDRSDSTDGQSAGHEFILYCEEEPKLDFSLPENFHIRVFLPSWKRDDILRKILWERRVAYMAEKDGCDVFLSLYQSSTIFLPASSMRHVMVVHDIIPKIFPEYRGNMRQAIHWKRVEQGIRMADHIVAVSKHTKDDLVRELEIAQEKISVVFLDVNPQFHDPVSPERVSTVLEKYGLMPGYIYHGGGLEIRKNTETLLRAYKSLRDQGQVVPSLIISGKIFDTKNKLATDVVGLIQTLRLQDSVKLLGFVPDEDLPALYSGALFFMYPSLYEGFGLPVLEALCMHTPVLSSDASSLPEVGGTAVLYTDPKNEKEMMGQMKRLIENEPLRTSLIAQSSSQIVQFSWKKTVQEISAILYK